MDQGALNQLSNVVAELSGLFEKPIYIPFSYQMEDGVSWVGRMNVWTGEAEEYDWKGKVWKAFEVTGEDDERTDGE